MNSSPPLYRIRAQWDSEAAVWIAESEDVPGLVAEAPSPNSLLEKLRILIPELLELNGVPHESTATLHVRYVYEDSGSGLSRHTANAELKQAGIEKQF